MTSITIIYNPNRTNGAEVRLHAADCRDCDKDSRGATTVYTAEFGSVQEAAEDFFMDMIDEGSMTVEDALLHTQALPCCHFPTEPPWGDAGDDPNTTP